MGWISFTTDYGLEDGFVGACVGVVAQIAPEARVVHVSHAVPPQDVERGAAVLADTVPYLPSGVHLAVVDPGVGASRRAVVLETPGGVFVGPDNGLLVPAADVLGGISAAYELTDGRYRLAQVSATFHGRDVFAPAAAHLVMGVPASSFGPSVDPEALVRLPVPPTVVEVGRVVSQVRAVDRFGNVQLNATQMDVERAFRPGSLVRVQVGGRMHRATLGRTFGDVGIGGLVVLVDSVGRVALAVNGGSAADLLGAGVREGDDRAVLITQVPDF